MDSVDTKNPIYYYAFVISIDRGEKMLFCFGKNEVGFYRCLFDNFKLPRLLIKKTRYGFDFFVSWLGGCVVWSRIRIKDKVNRKL